MQLLKRLTKHTSFNLVDTSDIGHLFYHAYPTLQRIFDIDAPIISKSDQSEIFTLEIDNQQFFIKRYFRTKGVASWLGLSRYSAEKNNQLWFNQSNLPSAKVIAFAEERWLFKTKRAALVTQAIENTHDLANIAEQSPESFGNKHWREQVLNQCAAILHFFHAHRFCHNDFHWRNILVQSSKTDSDIQVYLIDCPSGRKLYWPFLNYKILKDLANLDKFAPTHLTQTQRLRFFMAYRQIKQLSTADKSMIRNVLRHKAHRIKRKMREKARQ